MKLLLRKPLWILLAAAMALLQTALPSQAQQLVWHGGRILHHPRIHLVYYKSNWNASTNDQQLYRDNINNWVQSLVSGDYLARAGQYYDVFGSVGSGYVGSSNQSALGSPGDSTDAVSVHFWLAGEILLPGTGVPYPSDNEDLYVVLVPPDTAFAGDPGFTAYHFFGVLGLPPLAVTVPYLVIPLDRATADLLNPNVNYNGFYTAFDGFTYCFTHEFADAVMDPQDDFVGGSPVLGDLLKIILAGVDTTPGWFDSNIDIGSWAVKSEAADIAEFNGFYPVVWHNNAVVAAYWSNADHAIVAGNGKVHWLSLDSNAISKSPATLDDRPIADIYGPDAKFTTLPKFVYRSGLAHA